MDLILVLVAILLAGIAVWFWRLSKKQAADLMFGALLTPEPKVAILSVPKLKTHSHGYETIRRWLLVIVYLGLILTIVGIIYLILRRQSWSAIPLICVVLLILLYLYLLLRKPIALYESTTQEEIHKIIGFVGEATLPKRVYEGDSHNISVSLKPRFWIPETHAETLSVQDTKSGKRVVLQFPENGGLEQFLEIELLAAGLTIDGEKKQRQPLTSKVLYYRWNCYFPNSGNHTLTLKLSVVCPTGAIELGAIEHTIKVAKLDHLTKRQVWILASLAGIVSGGLVIAETLHKLGVW